MFRFNLIACFALVLFMGSCRRELEKPSWEIGVTGPVFYSSLGIRDLVEDSLVQVNADSSVTLVYEGTIYELLMDSLLEIPDTTVGDTFQLPFAVPSVAVNPGQQIFTQTEEQSFNAQGVQLTRVDLRKGLCQVSLSSTVNQPVDFQYEILSASKNNVLFSTLIPVPAGSIANPSTVDTLFDLSGYTFNMISSNGTEFNSYTTKTTVKMSMSAQSTTLTNNDVVMITNRFDEMEPSYAKGYFGQRTENVSGDPAYFDLFENMVSGSIDIDQVDVDLVIRNYIGADARITFNSILAENGAASLALNHAVIGNAININRAIDPGGYPQASVYSINLNNGNSNIDQILELLPKIFTADLELELNPLGNVSAHHDFLYHPQTFRADLSVALPLNLIASNLTLADTLQLNLQKGENGYVKSGNFTVEISNGFPLDGNLQLYFIDQYGMITDSVVSSTSFLPAFTNSQEVVTAKRDSEILLHLSESNMEKLYAGHRMLMMVTFSTSSLTQHVKIYDHYRIDLRVKGDFNYMIEFAE